MTARPGNSVLKGAIFAVSGRWIGRPIGMVSTIVLARLLMPEDFGVMAMASVVLGLVATFLDVGVNVALVRNAQATAEHFNSAWTLRMIQAGAMAALLLVGSTFAGDYFRDERVTQVLMLMSLTVLISALENIGIVSFQKEMRFGHEFRFLMINRLFAFVCTVGLAFWLRSYWALVISGMLGALFTVVHSYVAHPMRPRFSTSKLRELFSVSQWMLVQNIGGYFDGNLHKILVGRREDSTTMGAYSIAAELAALPSSELLQPLNRVLFPAFAAVRHDLGQLRRAFLLAQSVQIMVAWPAAVFLALLASDLVPLLLGPNWERAVPLLETLALGYALVAVQASAWYVSITLGQERRCAAVSWGQIALFALSAWVLVPEANAQRIAELRVIVAASGLGFQLWIVSRALGGVGPLEMLRGVWRTAVALSLTVALMWSIAWPGHGALVTPLVKGAFCVAMYLSTIWLLWRLSGRPEGAERYVAERLGPVLARLRRNQGAA